MRSEILLVHRGWFSTWGLRSFSSLKYHRLHPEYIAQRIDSLGTSYNLRILLILCDIVSSLRRGLYLSESSVDYPLNPATAHISLSTTTQYEN